MKQKLKFVQFYAILLICALLPICQARATFYQDCPYQIRGVTITTKVTGNNIFKQHLPCMKPSTPTNCTVIKTLKIPKPIITVPKLCNMQDTQRKFNDILNKNKLCHRNHMLPGEKDLLKTLIEFNNKFKELHNLKNTSTLTKLEQEVIKNLKPKKHEILHNGDVCNKLGELHHLTPFQRGTHAYEQCLRGLPTTRQIRYLCGTDCITYTNPSFLRNANLCGNPVQMDYWGKCDVSCATEQQFERSTEREVSTHEQRKVSQTGKCPCEHCRAGGKCRYEMFLDGHMHYENCPCGSRERSMKTERLSGKDNYGIPYSETFGHSNYERSRDIIVPCKQRKDGTYIYEHSGDATYPGGSFQGTSRSNERFKDSNYERSRDIIVPCKQRKDGTCIYEHSGDATYPGGSFQGTSRSNERFKESVVPCNVCKGGDHNFLRSGETTGPCGSFHRGKSGCGYSSETTLLYENEQYARPRKDVIQGGNQRYFGDSMKRVPNVHKERCSEEIEIEFLPE